MGQQQLLLLVLSTVIVGLATVAGIQAFSENQEQATQDALLQRANTLASDIAAAAQQPTQMGGIDLSSDNSPGPGTIANAIGLSSSSGIDASGAGTSASCSIEQTTDGEATVYCGSNGPKSGTQQISVKIVPSDDDPVKDPSITVNS